MRSPVQSWVPLQGSIADRCAFFVYIPSSHHPGGGIHYCNSHRKLAFKVAVVVMDAVSEANDDLRGRSATRNRISIPLPASLGKKQGTERTRRSRPAATETSWVPPLENFYFPCLFTIVCKFTYRIIRKSDPLASVL